MYSLRMSVWIVPRSSERVDALLLADADVEREQHRGRRVDRHRRRDLAERDPAEERLHVGERVDRHAFAADLAERARVVGVVAHQRRHVEGRREARLPVVEQVAEALVRLLGGAEAGELAHRPELPAVHRRVDAARERIDARVAEVAVVVDLDVLGRVERLVRKAGDRRGELALALRRRVVELALPLFRAALEPLFVLRSGHRTNSRWRGDHLMRGPVCRWKSRRRRVGPRARVNNYPRRCPTAHSPDRCVVLDSPS